MPSNVVIDASVVLASVLNEPVSAKASALLTHIQNLGQSLFAPLLLQYEVTATLRRFVYLNPLTTNEARDRLNTILQMSIRYIHDRPLLVRAFELATEFNRPRAYDTQYVALAERLGCEFWTSDEKLVNSLSARFEWVKSAARFSA